VDNTTQTVLVKARIANSNDSLRQSQFIRARVVWGTHQNPQVPILAVSRLAGQYFAFVAEPQNGGSYLARQKPLKIGRRWGTITKSQEGIKPGDKVIVSGTQVSARWGASDSAELRIGIRLRQHGPPLLKLPDAGPRKPLSNFRKQYT